MRTRPSLPSYAAFAAFGVFWGTWGAALPVLRDAGGLDEAALGTALLFVGLGALPAMLLSGRAIDRFGARIGGPLLIALGGTGVMMAVFGRDLPSLAWGMALVGAASGAADVAANAIAGHAEQLTRRRIITRSHAVFSSAVVMGSLGTGALRAAGVGVIGIFAAAGASMTVAGSIVFVLGPRARRVTRARPVTWERPARGRGGIGLALPFVAVGLVGALGFAAENAHQSWSAIFLADELAASAGLTAMAPATFAAFAALTRFAAGALTRISTGRLLTGGALVAVLGTLLISVAGDVPTAVGGIALAAIGTSVLFPTLLSHATRDVPLEQRGRATSVITATSYLGFVLGPVYVGVLAGAVGLRSAMVGVAVLLALFPLLAPRATRSARTRQDV